MKDIEFDIKKALALDIITNSIVKNTREYSVTQNKEESTKLKDKVNVLNRIKDEIYLGNVEMINKVIEKNRKGIL